MVRRLVGTLVQVGTGKLEPGKIAALLKSHSAETGPWTAPSAGLFLERVLYPGDPLPGLVRPAVPVGYDSNRDSQQSNEGKKGLAV